MATTQNKSELVIELAKRAGLFPGDEGAQHWQTHLPEMQPLAIEKAFALLDGRTGVVEVKIDNPFLMKTRLWGPLMGDADLSNEERTPYDRGEGRGTQEIIVRDTPMRSTSKVTFIIFPIGGVMTLITFYAGPTMPPMENDPEGMWKSHALAYAP